MSHEGVESSNGHLSRIITPWEVLRTAREGETEEARAARQELLMIYWRPIRSYLHRVLHNDREAAEELSSKICKRFLDGDCLGAKAELGCFHDYLKQTLFNMVR